MCHRQSAAAQSKGQPNSRASTRQAIRHGQKIDAKIDSVKSMSAAATGAGLGSKAAGACADGKISMCN